MAIESFNINTGTAIGETQFFCRIVLYINWGVGFQVFRYVALETVDICLALNIERAILFDHPSCK